MRHFIRSFFFCCLLTSALGLRASAQGTSFTYQGRLNNGADPANGLYDLRFAVFDASTGGTQQGSTITSSATSVSNGLFTATVDFGPGVFTGAARWLEVSVSTNGANAFSTLSPRQSLTSTPYAIQAGNAASASSVAAGNIVGPLTPTQLPAGIVTNGASGVSLSGTFMGDGSGLSGINATSVGGGFLSVTSSTPALAANIGISSGIDPEFALSGNYCYIAAQFSLLIYNIADPAAPSAVSSLAVNCNAALTSGNRLYLGTSTGLRIYDISSPATPVLLGTNGAAASLDLALSGNYCYAAADGLRVFDISNPANPVSVGHINNGGAADGVAVSGNFCYLANNTDGLRVYNVATPSNPVAIAHVTTTGSSFSVSVSGNYCYLASQSDGVRIYDVSNPTNPAPVGHIVLANAYRAVLANNICYLCNDADGLHLFDVSNPASPKDLGAVTGAYPFGLDAAVTPNYIFLTGAFLLQSFSLNTVKAPAYAGSGAELTGLNASQLAFGTIPQTVLPANVALLNNDQTFSGSETFGAATFNSSTTFNGPNDTISGTLNFGSTTRQMLNLWGTHYALGVQSAIEYFRSDFGFAWYEGGTHSDTEYNAGGGTVLMQLDPGGLFVRGTLVSTSDRAVKEHFRSVDPSVILDKVVALPISRWDYIFDQHVDHIGPVAQDFYKAFNVGPDEKHITTVDEGGVALSAIQGLNQKVDVQNRKLEAENAELKARLEKLERLLLEKSAKELK